MAQVASELISITNNQKLADSKYIKDEALENKKQSDINKDSLAGGVYNVTKLHQLQSGYYTITTAIAAIPLTLRRVGMVITYQTASDSWETKQFKGILSDWNDSGKWEDFGGGEAGDGVYDISAANPSASPFASLQAALGAITDTTKKKGGMTIKYIGSDEKYHQYRYAGTSIVDADFKNEANWEEANSFGIESTEISYLELNGISGSKGGIDVDSDYGCRTPNNSKIDIANGETIVCRFVIANSGNGRWSAAYKYLHGDYIGAISSDDIGNITNGDTRTITSDGTFDEIRFMLLNPNNGEGSAKWTQAQVDISYIEISRFRRKSLEDVNNDVNGKIAEVGESLQESKAYFEEHLGYKIVKTTDITLRTTNAKNSDFSNTEIGFERGKKYRLRSYTGVAIDEKISFYLRKNRDSEVLWINAGINMEAGDWFSDANIYQCIDEAAQYLSVYRPTKKVGDFRVRIEELETISAAPKEECEANDYNEAMVGLQLGIWGNTCSTEARTARIATSLIKVNGYFYFTLNDNYLYTVLYFNNDFTFAKDLNSYYYLGGKFKDNWNGYIGINIRRVDNADIQPSELDDVDFHVFTVGNYVYEQYPLELGAINGGTGNVDSTNCFRNIGSIPILEGETIFVTFNLAVRAETNYSRYYKYYKGKEVRFSMQALINHGSPIIITSDGTFDEVRFRIFGASSEIWTDALAAKSCIYVVRNLNENVTHLTKSLVETQKNIEESIQMSDSNIDNAIIAQTYKAGDIADDYNPLQRNGLLTLLHFSDIHGDVSAVRKALEYKEKYGAYIHDVIHTGDAVTMVNPDTNPFAAVDGGGTVINLIGNHDSWSSITIPDYDLTEQAVYDTMLADYIQSWGVVYQEGKTYYYKDYATQKIRVIFVDSIHWHEYIPIGTDSKNNIRRGNAENEIHSIQKDWFHDTLADAKSKGYAVVCVTHYQPKGVNYLKGTGFCVYRQEESGSISDGWFAHEEMFTEVDTFISGGGKFMCWMMGHTHCDVAGTIVNHPDQFMIGIDRGGITSYSHYDKHITGTSSGYVFNVTTFDSVNGFVKITRLGNCFDVYMQSKKTLCYDVFNKKLIYNT